MNMRQESHHTGHDHHAGHDQHGGHDQHAGHSPNMFRDKFWLSLTLTVPVVGQHSPIFLRELQPPFLAHALGTLAVAYIPMAYLGAVLAGANRDATN